MKWHNTTKQWLEVGLKIIWYRVLPQRKSQFLFAVRVGCVVIWPIFSTSKMKAFFIYFYQENITFKNIINLFSFIIKLVEYLVINSYSVTVLDNFRKETSDSAKKQKYVIVILCKTSNLVVTDHTNLPWPATPSTDTRQPHEEWRCYS